jgi:hypothetical protein
MTGLDLEAWRGRHALSVIDTSLALALPSAFHYNKLSRTEGALDLGMEILLRVYDEFPGAPAWRYPTIKQLFEAFYGPDRDAFFSVQGPEYSGYARSRLFTRFAAIFGRSMFSAHRWIERNGKVQADIARIQAKTVDMPDPRHDLERIAARVWALRGVDFETHFPRLGTELPANRRVRRTLDAKGVMKPSSVLVWSGDPAKKNRKKTLKNGTTDG